MNIDQQQMEANARFCAQRNITIPTFAQMRHPEQIPEAITQQLSEIGLWDTHPANLFRITWKNQPVSQGGQFGQVNAIELPSSLTGVRARIVALCGKWFPTGAHKVGATFGCLVPPLISGTFDPSKHKAVWPSTGNYCRGGAYVSKLLGCGAVAILPEGMSQERFAWLENVADEIIKTHGCESNVKEIFDKCWELRRTRPEVFIFNQFEELGNTVWHYNVTGPAMEEAVRQRMGEKDRLAGVILTSGSGGTLAGGYYLKDVWPKSRLAVSEALQCPTLLYNGFGDHRIEGIGDKHIPWIHDVKNTDMSIAVDDEIPMRLLRLFNEPEGQQLLAQQGVEPETLAQLDLMGISGIANLVSAIKYARYYELTEQDFVVTVFTDSLQMYGSRLEELRTSNGVYSEIQAHKDLDLLANLGIEHMQELNYYDRKRVHNLKYYTWVEQQQKDVAELEAQWYDHENYWRGHMGMAENLDRLITEFNDMVKAAR